MSEPGAPHEHVDEEYRAGAIDLLGVLAYGELSAFERLAEDANHAPTLPDKVMMIGMAARQFDHFVLVRDRLSDLDADVMNAMEPFYRPFDAYHEFTRPKTWVEGLVKTYVGDGFAADFYLEIAAFVDPPTRDLVNGVLGNEPAGDYLVGRVRQAISEEPAIAGRLALWGRRLVGEALSQAQRVAADRDALTSLLTGSMNRPGMDLVAMGRMFSRLVENHILRMERLGLQA